MAAMADGADDEDVLRRIALAPPPSVEARRELQQWMEKNHHGRPWKTTTTGGPRRRFFRLQGFKLEYFRRESDAQHCGCCDLRNVRMLGDATDKAAPPGAVELLIVERRGSGASKRLTIALPLDAAVRGSWLRHLCSAVSDDALPPAMRSHRAEPLARAIDDAFATQPTARGSLLGSTTPRTPRTSTCASASNAAGVGRGSSRSSSAMAPASFGSAGSELGEHSSPLLDAVLSHSRSRTSQGSAARRASGGAPAAVSADDRKAPFPTARTTSDEALTLGGRLRACTEEVPSAVATEGVLARAAGAPEGAATADGWSFQSFEHAAPVQAAGGTIDL